MRANMARFRACWRVALRMRRIFCVTLESISQHVCTRDWSGDGVEEDLRARAEEEDHDERVREADLAAVDDAIPDAFDESKDVMVSRIEDDLLERVLCIIYQRVLLILSGVKSAAVTSNGFKVSIVLMCVRVRGERL
jgi:hypothetical protein